MGQLLFILMRILFPCDPVARCRELMRVWLRRVMDAVMDPEEVESFAYWSEDRAKLEGAICFLEYFMRVLTYGRARQMLGLPHVHIPLQPQPHIRNPASMAQLFRRLTQLARDFHDLDALASRNADRIKRECDNDPLRLAATLQATSPALRAVEAKHRRLASTTSQKWGRWIARSCAQDGGGLAFARGWLHSTGPPFGARLPIADCRLPRSHLRECSPLRQRQTKRPLFRAALSISQLTPA